MPITATLQWLEGRKFGVDIKGQDPFFVAKGPARLYSSNHEGETPQWKRIDIEAFDQRCYTVMMKNAIPPLYRKNTGDKAENCKNCSLRALAEFVPVVANVWRKKKSQQQ